MITGSLLLDKHLELRPPNILYHYTSEEGLLGILTSHVIWATNVLFLNDLSEIKHAIELTKMVIYSIKKQHGRLSGAEIKLLDNFSDNLDLPFKSLYVASFTELQDSLSQWRGYCPKSGGYAIGFLSDQLNGISKPQGFTLVKCIYNTDEQSNIIKELVMKHLEDNSKKIKSGRNYEAAVSNFIYEINRLGLIMKNPSFEEENEWRLISGYI